MKKQNNMPKLNIKIIINEDEEQIAQRETSLWEVSEMNLDSLKRWYEKREKEKIKEEESNL